MAQSFRFCLSCPLHLGAGPAHLAATDLDTCIPLTFSWVSGVHCAPHLLGPYLESGSCRSFPRTHAPDAGPPFSQTPAKCAGLQQGHQHWLTPSLGWSLLAGVFLTPWSPRPPAQRAPGNNLSPPGPSLCCCRLLGLWDWDPVAAVALARALHRCWPHLLSEMWTGPWVGLRCSSLRAPGASHSPGPF